jgi:hypothetical protein
MMRVFYVVYVTDYALRKCIDAIRLLADPSVRWPAHITVRGPYPQPHNLGSIGATIRGVLIRMRAIGRFYAETQHTAYLACESPELRMIWDKPHYDYNPHITIYDGSSRTFSLALWEIMEASPVDRSFIADGLNQLVSGNGRGELCPRCVFDCDLIEGIIGANLQPSVLPSLDEADRLTYIGRLWEYLANHRDGSHVSPPIVGCRGS